MEELRKLFERETGEIFNVYTQHPNERRLIVTDGCSIKYAEWLEEKLKSPNSDYAKCADEIQIYYEDHNDVYQSEIIKVLKKHFA